jgi:hypothetical protein
MVDFPEGYGFAPGKGRQLMQSRFTVEVGVFRPREVPGYYVSSYSGRDRSRSRLPYYFDAIGFVAKDEDTPVRGVLYYSPREEPIPYITGTLQQIVTAMCTIHKLRGNIR